MTLIRATGVVQGLALITLATDVAARDLAAGLFSGGIGLALWLLRPWLRSIDYDGGRDVRD